MKVVFNGGYCLGKDLGAVGMRAAEADICRALVERKHGPHPALRRHLLLREKAGDKNMDLIGPSGT